MFRSGAPKVVGIMGLDSVSRNTEYCLDIETLTAPFFDIEKSPELSSERFNGKRLAEKALEVFNRIRINNPNREIFLILHHPRLSKL